VPVPALDGALVQGREVDLAEADEVGIAVLEHVQDGAALVRDPAQRHDVHALDRAIALEDAHAVGHADFPRVFVQRRLESSSPRAMSSFMRTTRWNGPSNASRLRPWRR